MVQLVTPSLEYQQSFIAAVKEFQREGRQQDISVQALTDNFEAFLSTLAAHEQGRDLPAGYVPSTTRWLVNDKDFIGRVSIRHRLTEKLSHVGGHIGYEVRPSKRKMGYGTKMLALALPLARKIGLKNILLTCDDANLGSQKIIEHNGGVLAETFEDGGVKKRRYWINE